jgi:thiamine-monophosphate kinase
MRLSDAGELSLLDTLRRRFGKGAPGLVLGIGDDSAVIRPRSKNMLLTSDMMVEGVHFDLSWITPYQLGFKLVSVNVSDIYAMGGKPEFMLLDFAAPGDFEKSQFDSLLDGIAYALKTYRLSLIGGDISAADRVVLSATVSGSAAKFVGRRGANTGDLIYVSGYLGDSACGLKVLKSIGRTVVIEKKKKADFGPGWKTVGPLVRRHLMPLAREPRRFSGKATAMMDISDGLFIDLSRLCKESGVGARIYADKIPISGQLRRTAEYLGIDPLDFATGGGEDYELLFTAPSRVKVDAFCIGEITGKGLRVVDCEGKSKKVSMRGYRHFAL